MASFWRYNVDVMAMASLARQVEAAVAAATLVVCGPLALPATGAEATVSPEVAGPPDIHDIRDLSDLAERAIAVEDVGFLKVGEDGRLTATSQGVLLMTPPPWQRRAGEAGFPSGAARAPGPAALPLLPVPGGIKTLNLGSSIEVQGMLRGLVIRAGQLRVPTGSQVERPAYFVFDHRPGWFWTASPMREMGLEVSFNPVPALGLTVGGYNNKGSYKFGTLIVKSLIGRIDMNLGAVNAGGFLYYGTGRWWGDNVRVGIDLRTTIGPMEVTGQVLGGMYGGIQQAGWYVDVRRQILPGTTLIARFDEHNPNVLMYSGLDSHLTFAILRRLTPFRTIKVNLQLGIADPRRVQGAALPSTWALIGQIWQRF